MRRNRRLSIVIIFALACLVAWNYFRKASHHVRVSGNSELQIDVESSPVKLAKVPQQITSLGSIQAKHKVDLSFEAAGVVSKVAFRSGQLVKKGDLLVQLDDTAATAKLNAARADMELSELKYQRLKSLVKEGLVAKQDYDTADAERIDKKNAYAVIHSDVNKMQIRAPFSGALTARNINRGDYVSVGQACVTIVDLQKMYVEYQVPEQSQGTLKIGQVVAVNSAAYPGKLFNGTVKYISPIVDPQTRTLTLRAALDSSPLTPGMLVQVQQQFGEAQNALLIPESAVLTTLDGSMVYRVNNHKAQKVRVNLGAHLGDQIVVISGLNANDHVVVAGQMKLKEGVAVNEITGASARAST